MGHFGDKSFQAIDCTGTDNQKQGKKTLHATDDKSNQFIFVTSPVRKSCKFGEIPSRVFIRYLVHKLLHVSTNGWMAAETAQKQNDAPSIITTVQRPKNRFICTVLHTR